jgi:hypothetical protein
MSIAWGRQLAVSDEGRVRERESEGERRGWRKRERERERERREEREWSSRMLGNAKTHTNRTLRLYIT